MLSIYSLNANGLRDIRKLKNLFTVCDIYKCDIICLQETFWSDDFMTEVKKFWKGRIFYNNYDIQHRKGVAILFKKDIQVTQIKHIIYGEKGRLLKVSFEHGDKNVNVFSVYAPNEYNARSSFFKNSEQYFNGDEINIVGGDFNDYLSTSLDRSETMSRCIPNNSQYRSFISENNLVDIWRHRNPDKRLYSRRQKVNGTLKQSRIDTFLISRNCMTYTKNIFYRLSSFSDHSYVCIHIDFNEIERGPGMWILNNTLLQDKYYCSRIEKMIGEAIQCPLYTREKLVWWDNLKFKLKSFSKYYSKKKYKEEKQEFWDINNKLEREYAKLDRGLNIDHSQVVQLENKLNEYEKRRCEGAILRSKASWAIESDKNTSYFLKLEKYRQESNSVKEVLNTKGEIISDTLGILETQVAFYENLYSEERIELSAQEMLFENISNKITTEEKELCETDIHLTHLTESLKDMNKNKSPGLDGLTVEFYCKFWKLLGPLLAEIVNEIQKTKHLTNTMQRGIISLIYKKKGDKKLLKNWRPITLLNVDYKIISKTLASRLKTVLESIISPEQTCSVPGRDISDNIASVRDIIHYCDEEKIQAYILKLDSEKAFDRVSHQYLLNLLPRFGFGEQFVEWIKIIYTDISSAVKCNGHISRFFNVKRSVRQGCSLSALLYIIAAEPLNLLIKQSELKGINIHHSNCTSLIYQHADDTTLTLADTDSITQSFKLFDIFGKASGAKVNVEKSEVLIVNDVIDSLTPLQLPLVVKTDFIEVLGIAVGNYKDKCEEFNWKKKIDKIASLMNLWQQRSLSLRGRSVVIQTLLSSRIWYTLNVMPLPKWVEEKLRKSFSKFLWLGKPPQIKAVTLIGKESQGGLNIPDLRSRVMAFRLKWLRKYFNKDVDFTWKHTMNYFLKKYQNLGLTYEIFALIYEKNSLGKMPPVYKELMEAWNDINEGKRETPSTLEDIYNQPMFSNPNITKNNRMLFFHVFIKCNITKIVHIVNQESKGFITFSQMYDKIKTVYPAYDKNKAKVLYSEIMTCIPGEWKNRINETHLVHSEISIPNIVVDDKTIKANFFSSKLCYDVLRSRKFQTPTATPFIESFGLQANENFWKSVFGKYKSPDMINLDYKIAHSIVWTREKLYMVKISDTNVCPVCEEDIEDLLHLFIECDCLEHFHEFLIDILTYFYRNVGFTRDDFIGWLLFGSSQTEIRLPFINLILSSARIAIYKRRNIMVLKSKNIDCKFIFNLTIKQQLECILYQYKLDTFNQLFMRDNPFIRIDNSTLTIQWQ